jgi:alkaline phosphatase
MKTKIPIKLEGMRLLILTTILIQGLACHMHPRSKRSLNTHTNVQIPGDDTNPKRWLDSAGQTLTKILSKKQKTGLAKNVIIFLGDGMGMTTITAGPVYKGQAINKTGEEELTYLEQLDDIGLSKVSTS